MRKSAYALASVATALLLLALLPMPYGYYTILRLVICAIFVVYATALNDMRHPLLQLVAWVTVVTYNPLIPVHLGRDIWSTVNILTIVLAWPMAWKIRRPEQTGEDQRRN